MLRTLTSLIVPPVCGICGDGCHHRDRICRRCALALARLRPERARLPGGLEVVSAAPYEGVARDLVARLKFSARLALAEVAADRMVRAWGATRAGALVPVPPAPARRRRRGYDVADLLARLVADEADAARYTPLLARGDGPRQVGRQRQARLSGPPRVELSARAPTPGEPVWLVDDVATTGATLRACARVLEAAGARSVRALAFARAA